MSERALAIGTVVAVLVFTALAYARSLRVPFLGDDYVFLGKTRYASFWDIWSLGNTDFGWYRPWSRELHFWVLQHLFGPNEAAFRVASLALWLGALGLQALFVRRIAGPRIAAFAMLGTASLSMWGAPLNWSSGTQDLWMLLFAALTLWLHTAGRRPLAWAAYAGALLCKETAATIPLIVLAHDGWLGRLQPNALARRLAPFGVITFIWLTIHPTLLFRLRHPDTPAFMAETPVPAPVVAMRSLLSLVNSDSLWLARDPQAERWLTTIASALALAFGAWLWARGARRGFTDSLPHPRAALLGFGCTWCLTAWIPMFLPSVGWHAYYGSLGAFGAWLAISAAIDAVPRLMPVLLLLLGLLRGMAAATRSWDWGSEWYQSRAGNMLGTIRDQLTHMHPTLPRYTRLYFGNIPNNIGLIAGNSPAVRVWYDDTTIQAGFYSYYRPRGVAQPAGPDLFFHFDSMVGLREVSADGTHTASADLADWLADHESLAMMFVTNGDYRRAARLFERIAALSDKPDYHMYAAVCWQMNGAPDSARTEFEHARVRSGGTPRQIALWAERLIAALPKR